MPPLAIHLISFAPPFNSFPLPSSAIHAFPLLDFAIPWRIYCSRRHHRTNHFCTSPLPLGSRPFKSLPVHCISNIANPLQSYAVPARLTAFQFRRYSLLILCRAIESIPSYAPANHHHAIPMHLNLSFPLPKLCTSFVSVSLAYMSSLCGSDTAQFYSVTV